MNDAVIIMPRINAEIMRVEELLNNVQNDMSVLVNQLNSFDQRNVNGVEDLSRLDTLKSNMEKCKSTLEEHTRWNHLVRDTKTFLESGGKLIETADK